MIRFELTLECDNDAFEPTEDECDGEVARILREVAGKVESGALWASDHNPGPITIHDSNGNLIGRADYVIED